MFHANYAVEEVNSQDEVIGCQSVAIKGETVEEISKKLAEVEYDGPSVEVRDEPGFLRGWASATDWRNA